jgi:aspartyl-tRNA(Asn)/glutamyl-tRNA(Gln) amidotransferase subunit A
MSLINKSASELAELLRTKQVSSVEITSAQLAQIDLLNPKINSFLSVTHELALSQAKEVDELRAKGQSLSALAGVPIAVKDNLTTIGIETTAGSKILAGWLPPYNATVVEKILASRMPILGKTNMDEFAMGSSTEFSAYGPSLNPWDLTRTPGGSGGGSSSAVASMQAPIAIGSDTGGSIRFPAAVTGSVGVKPTYGAVSRYGLIALGSSLDQIGPVSRNVMDAAMLQDAIAGFDPMDATSLPESLGSMTEAAKNDSVKGLRIGIIRELTGDGFQAGVSEKFQEALELLVAQGAEVVEVSCPSFQYAIAAYYLIQPAEASSNLARFDSVRFGLRVMPEGLQLLKR